MNKKDNEDFKNSTKRQICGNNFVNGDVKVRDHCYITGKYRNYVNRDCKNNVKANHKIPIEFRNLQKYDFNLIMLLLFKFNLKINVIGALASILS